jgi:hypothetical protein
VAILYDPPSLFSPLWAMLTPFMDVKTASKVKFLTQKKARAALTEYADLSQWERSVGGDLKYEFDFQVRRVTATPQHWKY